MHAERALVVDDDAAMREVLTTALRTYGFSVISAADGEAGLDRLDDTIDIALLDVNLPDMDGLQLLRRARARCNVPVIFVSANTAERDRIAGLDVGADDYVVKPFSVRELISRVHAVLRRSSATPPAPLNFVDFEVDRERRRVVVAGQPVGLTPREFDLIAYLASHPDRPFTREELLVRVWNSSGAWQDRDTVTEHVRRLRRKLDAAGAQQQWIKTVRGGGYLFAT